MPLYFVADLISSLELTVLSWIFTQGSGQLLLSILAGVERTEHALSNTDKQMKHYLGVTESVLSKNKQH